MHRDIIFNELEKYLLKLGFTALRTSGSHKVFQHPSSEALVILPAYEQQAYVHPVHLLAVRRILIENELIDRNAFDSFLEKVAS
ncbi:type II toxin-antitoxin system HicA family toxin [Brasilonema bromeliae]|uniref:Type II toxin-antitoxin system HicA family toxin n=1 Tax=Brasilonema bromeliae SPC951 TaxID=385972 RepID=A0ABX1P9Y3_9CYAN|nr:type II toxin-antitoxin system HicA family toxin [Brasilonema bromeliae]NMG21252.1 type II toxin-antitoxin system HicA family toxin [Brasilonema bromeliae SPC951]